jgi:hypothetical protein
MQEWFNSRINGCINAACAAQSLYRLLSIDFMDVENQRLLFHGKDYTLTALYNLAFFYEDFKPIGFIYQASPKGCYISSSDGLLSLLKRREAWHLPCNKRLLSINN